MSIQFNQINLSHPNPNTTKKKKKKTTTTTANKRSKRKKEKKHDLRISSFTFLHQFNRDLPTHSFDEISSGNSFNKYIYKTIHQSFNCGIKYLMSNKSMEKLVLSTGFLCCYCGLALAPLAPSAWLGWCGVAGLDSVCDGMTLIFHVVFDLGGITYEGSICFSCLFPNSPVKSSIYMW